MFHPGGDVFITGRSGSPTVIGSAGGAIPMHTTTGGDDIIIGRFTADLTTVVNATYWGADASGSEAVTGLAIEPDGGQVHIAGTTNAITPLPASMGAPQPMNGGISLDGYFSTLDSDLTTIVASTFIGGSGNEHQRCLARHPFTGELYVAGLTHSTNYPMTMGGGDPTQVSDEGFIMRLWLVPPPPPCYGDCDMNGTVTAAETSTIANIIAGLSAAATCPLSDADTDGDVDALDLGVALANAALGCP